MDYELLILVLYFSVYFRRGVPSARTNEQGHDERSITENDEETTEMDERTTKEWQGALREGSSSGTKKIAERNDAEGVAGGRRSTYMLYTASFGRGNG